jgi:hypothetical protein
MNRSNVHLFVGCVIGGFVLQIHWAVNHTFENLDVRIWASAFFLFVILWLVRKVIRVASPGLGNEFETVFAECWLLLAVTPAFLMISNPLLRFVAVSAYLVLVAIYMVRVLGVRWVAEGWKALWRLANAFRGALGKSSVLLQVRDDRDDRVLEVAVRGRDPVGARPADLKACIAALYEDLPEAYGYRQLRVDVGGLEGAAGNIRIILDVLASYARLMGIEDLVVVGSAAEQAINDRDSASGSPAYRFEQSGAG